MSIETLASSANGKVDAREVMAELEGIEKMLADAIKDAYENPCDTSEDGSFFWVCEAKRAILDMCGKLERVATDADHEDITESVIANGTTRLIDTMYERAKQFPVADRDEAVATLVEAAGEMATLADVLIMLAGTTDGDMHDALIDCSKRASSATMNSIRAVRFIARKA